MKSHIACTFDEGQDLRSTLESYETNKESTKSGDSQERERSFQSTEKISSTELLEKDLGAIKELVYEHSDIFKEEVLEQVLEKLRCDLQSDSLRQKEFKAKSNPEIVP